MMRVARGPKSEEDMRAITDENEQCSDYSYKGQNELSKKYPKDSAIATIVDGDTEAAAIWKEIQDSGIIPKHVAVKEDDGDHMGISDDANDSYPKSDPDCWWTATGCTTPKADGLNADISECPEPGTWGLTFDDGPNCSHNAFYDFLQQNKLTATMFFIGANVMDWPYQAQRALVDGHDVCLHTWSHHYMTTLTDEQVFAELYYSIRIIKDVVGVTTRCWRPPFGDVDDRVRAIAHGLGLRTILWKEDTDDWNIAPSGNKPTASIDGNYEKIISKESAGAFSTGGPVVLTHEIDNHTMTEFERMYPKIKEGFAHVAPIHACMNATRPYAEAAPTYPAWEDWVAGKGVEGVPAQSISVMANVTITAEGQQTEPGGYSPQSPQ
ncbi:hypothetical protein MCUN1_002722, partial [Malassezia cuniculi]